MPVQDTLGVMRVCRRCGVYGPPETGVCDGCGGDLRDQATSVERGRYRCAALRVERTCPACSRRTPVDGLPFSGVVHCFRCGEEHQVDPEEWGALLAAAHGVADLLDEDPEGADPGEVAIDEINPFSATAKSSAGIWFGPDDAGAWTGWLSEQWRVWVAPGVPLGPDSYLPYDLQADGAGQVVARSERGGPLRYAIEPAWIGICPGLRGAIAEDHLVGRADPEVVGERGHWRCPSCEASLSPPRRSRVRCGQCRTVLFVPPRVRRASQADPEPDTWFLVFEGPSPHRLRLERDPAAGPDPRAQGDRPLQEMPRAQVSGLGRALRIAYVLGVPLLFVALAGLAQRLPQVLAWLGR